MIVAFCLVSGGGIIPEVLRKKNRCCRVQSAAAGNAGAMAIAQALREPACLLERLNVIANDINDRGGTVASC